MCYILKAYFDFRLSKIVGLCKMSKPLTNREIIRLWSKTTCIAIVLALGIQSMTKWMKNDVSSLPTPVECDSLTTHHLTQKLNSFEKFYLGGSTSMRGWEVLRFSENENKEPNGETIRLMTNIEIRQKIYKSFGMTVFSDGGLLAEVFPKEFYSELIWDSGIGITVDTPLGPARLDYAIQLNDFSKQKLQLGVQNLF